MANNRDTILLETVKTHRDRLLAAFLYGQLTERRVVNDNIKRLIGSVVLGAVICSVCVGYSLVTSLIAKQNATKPTPTANVTPGISDQPYASDNFDRTRRRGWGNAETGGGWATSGPVTAYAVRGGAGIVEVPAGRTRTIRLPGVLRESADLTTGVTVDQFPATVRVVGRDVADSGVYAADLRFTDEHQVAVTLVSRQDGKTVPLSDTVSVRPPTQTGTEEREPGTRVRLQVFGTNPTRLRARVWPVGQSEPTDWAVVASDGEQALQRTGAVGLSVQLPARGDDGSVAVDDFVSRPVI